MLALPVPSALIPPMLVRPILALLLSALLAVTGAGLASARAGIGPQGAVMVLCSGGGLVQIRLDADGKPTGDSHLCPDLAAVALAALDLAPVDLAPRLARPVAHADRVAADLRAGALPRAFSARGPPLRFD